MALEQAFRIASTPPTGPVFVALPIDFMEGETDAVIPWNPTPPGRLPVLRWSPSLRRWPPRAARRW